MTPFQSPVRVVGDKSAQPEQQEEPGRCWSYSESRSHSKTGWSAPVDIGYILRAVPARGLYEWIGKHIMSSPLVLQSAGMKLQMGNGT